MVARHMGAAEVAEIKRRVREDVLEATDDPEIEFQARSVLQRLVIVEERLGGDPPTPTVR